MNWRQSDTIVGVIGDHFLDKDYSGTLSQVMSREVDDMRIFNVNSRYQARYSGGGAANIVDLLQEWGVRVLPVGVWNPQTDVNSQILSDKWKDGFVNTKHMILGSGIPAYVKYYTEEGRHIFRADESVPEMRYDIPELIRHIKELANEIDVLIVAGYKENDESILIGEVILEAIHKYIKCPKIGLSRKRLRDLQGYSYIVLDEEELEEETGLENGDRLSSIFSLFYDTHAVKILLTLKGKGAALYDWPGDRPISGRANIEETLVRSQELTHEINTCGCGDTFVAAFTICLASGMTEVESIKRANAAARVQCRKLYGAHTVPIQEWELEYETLYQTKGADSTEVVSKVT